MSIFRNVFLAQRRLKNYVTDIPGLPSKQSEAVNCCIARFVSEDRLDDFEKITETASSVVCFAKETIQHLGAYIVFGTRNNGLLILSKLNDCNLLS